MDGNEIDIIAEERCATPPSPGPGTIVHVEQPQQPYDEDEHSGELREYNGVFEGPEKTLGKCETNGVILGSGIGICGGVMKQCFYFYLSVHIIIISSPFISQIHHHLYTQRLSFERLLESTTMKLV